VGRVAGARVLVVGGQSRNIGKTALVAELIRAFPEANWTAVKITQYGHGVCAHNGAACSCAARDHAAALDDETDPGGRSDSARMLAAGARRALWLRTRQGRLEEGLALLERELEGESGGGTSHLILESNSLVGLVSPTLYLVVLDPAVGDFKPSCRRFLERADAFVLRRPAENVRWNLPARPAYVQEIGQELPAGLRALVEERFFGNQKGRKA